jgi:hypothetical protein
MAALCVVNDIEAIVMPSGVFGCIAFLRNLQENDIVKSTKQLTVNVQGLDAVLVKYKASKIVTELYRSGKVVKELIPTQVLGNLSETAEDALIGQLDLFELVASGKAHVSVEDALASLPSNFIPKKYQRNAKETGTKGGSNDSGAPKSGEFEMFYTKNMPKPVALETLKQFRSA